MSMKTLIINKTKIILESILDNILIFNKLVISKMTTNNIEEIKSDEKITVTKMKFTVNKILHSALFPSANFIANRFCITLFKPISDIVKKEVRADITIQSL